MTVRDSSADKSGKIVSTGNVGIGVNHDSTTTIEYANIEAVEGAVITGYATGAKITIEDGIFEASDNAVIAGNGNSTDHNGEEREKANTITINGGKFTGNIKTTGYIACGIYAPWKDIVTVNGRQSSPSITALALLPGASTGEGQWRYVHLYWQRRGQGWR